MAGLGKLLSNGNVRCADQKFTENGKVAELCKTKTLFKNLLNFNKHQKNVLWDFMCLKGIVKYGWSMAL